MKQQLESPERRQLAQDLAFLEIYETTGADFESFAEEFRISACLEPGVWSAELRRVRRKDGLRYVVLINGKVFDYFDFGAVECSAGFPS